MQAVMMVAGQSTRTYPLTLTRPKPLLPIINRPILLYNLDQLTGLVDEVILIVGYRQDMIFATLGTSYRGMKLVYQEQKEQLGTGHAVLQAAQQIRDRFIVMNGDDLFVRKDIQKLLAYRFAALAMPVANPAQFGIFQINEIGHTFNLIEKPKENIGNLANVGCYIFQPSIFPILAKTPLSERGEIEIIPAITETIKQEPFQVISISGYWLPTGFPWDLLKTQQFLFERDFRGQQHGITEKGAIITGEVEIGAGTIIRSGARIIGPVSIGSHSEIIAGSVVGPYTSLGDAVTVAKDCVIAHSLIMSDSRIGAGSVIRHSIIGYECVLGEGCHLQSENPKGESVQSLVKGKWVDTHLRQLGSTLADSVQLGAATTIAPGCKLWPKVIIPSESQIIQDVTL